MKLQTILLPDKDICDEESLYFHRDGEWLSFDGYFNLFYLEKHHKYCDIQRLTLQLRVSGISKIQIMHNRDVVSEVVAYAEDSGYNRIRKAAGKIDDGRLSIELPYNEFTEGVLYFRALVNNMQWSIAGHFEAQAQAVNPVRIGVNICTFKREKYVLRNMKSLTAFLQGKDIDKKEADVAGNMHVFIIDNGKTLLENGEFSDLISKSDRIEVIPNANTGGTGGFSRGMKEAICRREELGLTHLLMMDDDAVFDPDLFIRLYGFLSLLREEYREITVGGGLMREDYKYIQHAAGEWFSDFKVLNDHPLSDMRTYEACTQDFVTSTEKEHQLYGAWWCCCYHMNAVTEENIPLPIFVHHDDIQFGMRQTDRGIVFLNGISVWHQGFETSFPGVKQYYNMRNTLITMQMYEPERLREKMLHWTIRRYIGMLINYRYGDCEFVYRGLMDFLKGKEWILNSDPEAIHKELMADYKRICPMRELSSEEKELVAKRNLSLTPDTLRQYYSSERFEGRTYKKLTFNGWFLPGKRSLKVITPLDSPWEVFRQKRILLYEPSSGKGTIVKRENREFFKGVARLIEMSNAINKWKKTGTW